MSLFKEGPADLADLADFLCLVQVGGERFYSGWYSFEVRQASVSALTGIRFEMDAHAIRHLSPGYMRYSYNGSKMDAHAIRHLSPGNIGKFRIIVLSLYIVETIKVKIV